MSGSVSSIVVVSVGRQVLEGIFESLHFRQILHKCGFTVLCHLGCAMKTTVEVSDDLYRRAKSEATLRGRKLKDPVEERLRLVLEATAFRGSTSATRNPMPEFLGIIRAAMLTSRSR